ncbi:MAG: TraB/GumN family protein [Gammaproteobacteria bacterium]|nr:TraB/GumN family protein [Gammaproteobacteria bacterium]
MTTPEPLSPAPGNHPITQIQLGDHQITLLGTAHVSRASADKVRELIESGEFDSVAIELCPSRHNSLINQDSFAKMDLLKVIREGKASMVAASLALSAYQQRMAEEFNIRPGEEMRVAIDCAQHLHLPVLLIDREVGTTLRRVYHNVPWWKRFNLAGGLFTSLFSQEKVTEADIERLKQGDVLESTFAQFADSQEDIYTPLVDERDRYMAARLRQEHAAGPPRKTLAVIGAGHLKGIERYLNESHRQPEAEISQLDTIPSGNGWFKYIPWLIVLVILAGFAFGFAHSPDMGWQMVMDWIVINGSLAAIGTLIAGGHILTILAAFVAAPITSLNPAIGAGMVTALVETFLRRPTIGDFSQLRQDTTQVRGWWRNRVTRILLVFFLSSLGSAMGTYIAGFAIFERLSQ